MVPNPPRRGRVHIVLVPGFSGFDALGQLEYYAGVTPQFQLWKKLASNQHDDVALHYFDNFPTAAVRTRADRLRKYLAKRIARGEFVSGDSLTLVGHSTGGLDIRRVLWDLVADRNHSYPVDGATGRLGMVSAKDILDLVDHVVFLSVPQWGTNIADWVRGHTIGRELVVANLRGSFAVSQVPVLDILEAWLANCVTTTTKLGFVYAVRDALREAEAGTSRDPMGIAMAQEAASEVQLWLRHIATDFSAINDLASYDPCDPDSPAHFDAETRREEIAKWKQCGITRRSYATLGVRPFHFPPGQPAPRWDLLNPLTYPDCTPRERPGPATDIVYRYLYRACAGGPFAYPDPDNVPVPKPFVVTSKPTGPIELWDNDGIVNTASMLWPDGNDTLLVEGDHMDIVGHYKPVLATDKESGRKYQAYDLLNSGPGFDDSAFKQVWNHIFDFGVSQSPQPASRSSRVRRRRSQVAGAVS